MTRQHIVFLTGAGVSAESGLSTFRVFKTTATEGMKMLLEAFKEL